MVRLIYIHMISLKDSDKYKDHVYAVCIDNGFRFNTYLSRLKTVRDAYNIKPDMNLDMSNPYGTIGIVIKEEYDKICNYIKDLYHIRSIPSIYKDNTSKVMKLCQKAGISVRCSSKAESNRINRQTDMAISNLTHEIDPYHEWNPIEYIENNNLVKYNDHESILKIDSLHRFINEQLNRPLIVSNEDSIDSIINTIANWYEYTLTTDIIKSDAVLTALNTYKNDGSNESLDELRLTYLNEYYRLYEAIRQKTTHRLHQANTIYLGHELAGVTQIDNKDATYDDWIKYYHY